MKYFQEMSYVLESLLTDSKRYDTMIILVIFISAFVKLAFCTIFILLMKDKLIFWQTLRPRNYNNN